MKARTLLLFFIFSFLISYSQQTKIDSLKSELKKVVTPKEKLEIYKSLCAELINYSSPDESIPYFLQMSSTAQKIDSISIETLGYRYLSESYVSKGNFQKAEKFALKALITDDSIKNTKGYLLDINQLGSVYYYFQKYNKAIETYKKGIAKYSKYHQDKAVISAIYSSLGHVYGRLDKREKEIQCYITASEYADSINDIKSKIFALYSIAYVYMELTQYGKAEKYFFKALEDSSQIKLKKYVFMNHHGLGINYSRCGKYNKALKHNRIALNYYQNTGDKLYEFDVLNNTAGVYLRMKQPENSLKYAKEAFLIANELNHKLAITGAKLSMSGAYIDLKIYNKAEKLLLEIEKDTIYPEIIRPEIKNALYENLYAVYKGKKDYKNAVKYLEKFKSINDSILTKQRDSKITETETKYQTEKKEKENLQLKKEKAEQTIILQKEKQQKTIFLGLLVALLLFFSVFAYYFRRNKKQKALIENLQKELHHRIKNNLSVIDTFIEVAKEEFNNTAFNNKLTELQNRIAGINEVHKQLYNSKDITNIHLKKYVQTLADNVAASFNNDNIELIQEIDDSLKLYADKSFPVGLIINEFITNSFKYAFAENKKGKINVKIQETKNAFLLNLSDNGKGLPENFDIEKTETFGMRIMKLLAEQLKGTFQLESTNGLKINIQFPK